MANNLNGQEEGGVMKSISSMGAEFRKQLNNFTLRYLSDNNASNTTTSTSNASSGSSSKPHESEVFRVDSSGVAMSTFKSNMNISQPSHTTHRKSYTGNKEYDDEEEEEGEERTSLIATDYNNKQAREVGGGEEDELDDDEFETIQLLSPVNSINTNNPLHQKNANNNNAANGNANSSSFSTIWDSFTSNRK